jgi:hypothetical protein
MIHEINSVCLRVYHTSWLSTKDRYTCPSSTSYCSKMSRSEREKDTFTNVIGTFIEDPNSHLFGLSGPQSLDSHRLETYSRLRVNQDLSLAHSFPPVSWPQGFGMETGPSFIHLDMSRSFPTKTLRATEHVSVTEGLPMKPTSPKKTVGVSVSRTHVVTNVVTRRIPSETTDHLVLEKTSMVRFPWTDTGFPTVS